MFTQWVNRCTCMNWGKAGRLNVQFSAVYCKSTHFTIRSYKYSNFKAICYCKLTGLYTFIHAILTCSWLSDITGQHPTKDRPTPSYHLFSSCATVHYQFTSRRWESSLSSGQKPLLSDVALWQKTKRHRHLWKPNPSCKCMRKAELKSYNTWSCFCGLFHAWDTFAEKSTYS